MSKHLWAAAALATPLLFSVASPAAAGYTVQTVTDPTGTNFINLLGINDAGTIAGFDNANNNQGFTLTLPANFTPENFPAATSTMVTAINANGDTGGIYVDAGGTTHGFTQIGGNFNKVDDPGSVFNQVLGINKSNTTVGYFSLIDPAGMIGQTADSQSKGVFTNINRLLPANQNSQAVGINNANEVVGFYQPTATTSVGFLDNAGAITPIDPLGSAFTQALGINDMGEIVGFYVDGNGFQHGYIDSNGVFTTFDPTGSTSTTINGVNDLGQIVGFYSAPNNDVVGFVGTPIPDPAAPIVVALGGLIAARLRRRTVCCEPARHPCPT